MTKASKHEAKGVVSECLPGTRFLVRIMEPEVLKDLVVNVRISGKMRMHYIKIIPGDEVRLELDDNDIEKGGRIIFRNK